MNKCAEMPAKLKITVCIASIGRTSLLATLQSLEQCHLSADMTLDIVIADDSASGAVGILLSEPPTIWPFEIKIVSSAAGNISIARNLCLNNATGDYLAFIDDDETADKGWLMNFTILAKATNADAIFGPVNAIYPPSATKWICDAKPFVKVTGQNGDQVNTGSTCNAFVKHSIIKKLKLSFRPEFGRSGGEDTAFFAQLNQMGGILIASENAMVYEDVPLERLKLHHLRRRYIRGGHTYANLFIAPKNLSQRLILYANAAIKTIVLLLATLMIIPVRKDLALKYAFKLWLNIGKLRCLLNMQPIKMY
jgi:succinoglycan biosynthesis protein ExoM